MALRLYNTLSGKKEEFEPQVPGKVGMYVCGVTVYDECHLGHARCYLAFDTIFRYLKYNGLEVNYVQNFTDVDDKIINRAKENNEDPNELTKRYIERYYDVFDRLGVQRANHYPRATEEIDGMIKMIETLIEKGNAYEANGDVYFSTSSFKGYGKLSNRTEESMLAGARVEISEFKKNPLDFALWKKSKEGEPSWDSPWGAGRPGWHIECSVMSQKYLGDTLDIHGGGQDLIFPHHENEIAQSEATSGKPFVRYFLHNGFVTVDGEKMSKSLGNFRTLQELYGEVDPQVLRFFILSTHYRSPLTFTGDKLLDAAAGLEKLRQGFAVMRELSDMDEGGEVVEMDKLPEEKDLIEVMDDDVNSAAGIGIMFRAIRGIHVRYSTYAKTGAVPKAVKSELQDTREWMSRVCNELYGFDISMPVAESGPEDEVMKLVDEREAARKEKRFEDADSARDKILELGYTVKDTPTGPKLVKK